MESGFETDVRTRFLARIWGLFLALFARLGSSAISGLKKVKKLGQDDPRRIAHALKLALTITLASLFYYINPIYNWYGGRSISPVITAVLVSEYYAGATIYKFINGMVGGLVACFISLGVHSIATLTGNKGNPTIIGISVFFLAACSTFLRFFPRIKERYDYGMLVFTVMFSLFAVSGYRVDSHFKLAYSQFSTIAMGCISAVMISILVIPVWAGRDLHMLISINMEKLAGSLEGLVDEYFKDKGGENVVVKEEKPFVQAYKSVINSKSTEELVANFARWEPGHGRFRFRHPWKQYLKIGMMTRHCAYCIEALNSTINSEIQVPEDFRLRIRPACLKLSSETSKVLAEMAVGIRTMTAPATSKYLLARAKTATDDLQTALETTFGEQNHDHLPLSILPISTIASLLVETLARTEKLAAAVEELTKLAGFVSAKSQVPHAAASASVKPVSDKEDPFSNAVVMVLEANMTDSKTRGINESPHLDL